MLNETSKYVLLPLAIVLTLMLAFGPLAIEAMEAFIAAQGGGA
jgi:hypothetical protein